MYDPTCNLAIIVENSQQKRKAIQRWYTMSATSLLRHLPYPIFIAAKQGKMYISSRIDSPPLGNLASHATSTPDIPLPDCLKHNLNSQKAFAWWTVWERWTNIREEWSWYDHRHLYLVVNDTLELKWILHGKWRGLRQCLMPCDDRWDALTIELARLTYRTNMQLTISFDWKISNTIANHTAVFALALLSSYQSFELLNLILILTVDLTLWIILTLIFI